MQDISHESELPQARIAVLHGSEDTIIAKIALVGKPDGTYDLSMSGNEPDMGEIKNAILEATVGVASTQSLKIRLPLLKEAICTRLEHDGFKVSDLPAGDMSLSFEFDFDSGRTIGRQATLHEFVEEDSEIARNIHTAMTTVFERGPKELTVEIEGLIDAGDYVGAAEAVKTGRGGMGFFGTFPPELLDALQKICVTGLDANARKLVRECRLAVAIKLGRYDATEDDVSALLNEVPITDQPQRASLENVTAIASMKRGEVETALSIWRKLLKTPELIETQDRGWIWRNYSMALPKKGDEAIKAARLSVDAFLEAGDKHQAASSLMLLSELLKFENPSLAIEKLDSMLDIITRNGLIGSELRASIHHTRGNQLNELRNYSEAFKAAIDAVELRRGVLGVEQELISSLHLASITANNSGNAELADQLNAEAKDIEVATSSTHFDIARRIESLFSTFDRAVANTIISDALATGDSELITAAGVAIAASDPDLDVTSRLRRLEEILRHLELRSAHERAKQPVMTAIAVVLRNDGQFARAATWLRRILDFQPVALDARDMLIDSLWRAEDWGEAAIFLKAQIELHGEAPGLLYAYGRSLVEAGNVSAAIPVLSKALTQISDNDKLHDTVMAIRERALQLGGTVPSLPPASDSPRPILRDELEQALREFALFIAADKRMGFWTRPTPKDDYVWISKPEQRSQDLLHTFLKARFQTRISLFEELDTGAGRLDLLLKLDGGLSVIIELKMCGFGYSSTYAASGEKQIHHYMQNRSTHLGYLVVLDARLDNNSQPLIQHDSDGADTVCEVLVDVRPRVSTRKASKRDRDL